MTDGMSADKRSSLQVLALQYLNSDLSAEQLNALQEQLSSDSEAAQCFARFIEHASLVREQVLREDGVRKELSIPGNTHMDFETFLAALTPPDEELPPVDLVEYVRRGLYPSAEQKPQAPLTPQQPLTFPQAAGLAWHLFIHSRAAVATASGIAAVIALAVILTFVFAPGSSPYVPLTDTTENGNNTDALPRAATLTAQFDAQWQVAAGYTAPQAGDALLPGQRLSLSAGFATVTTSQGAVAILEAPCEFEMIDGNAMRLTRGKLMGVVETDQAKGFLVRTPHMNVTDLGTRFGVDLSQHDVTAVHIFEGEVKVELPSKQAGTERLLSAGQAVSAKADSEAFDPVAKQTRRFKAIRQIDRVGDPAPMVIPGVVRLSGDIWVASKSDYIGKPVNTLPTDDDAVLFNDFVGTLAENSQVCLTRAGKYNTLDDDAKPVLPAGTAVSSYVIYKTGNPNDTTTVVRGSVTFDREVVGIITTEETDNTFSKAVGANNTLFYPGTAGQRWLDLHSFEEHVTLSEDRKTVSFQFQVKRSTDTIRVLVRGEE